MIENSQSPCNLSFRACDLHFSGVLDRAYYLYEIRVNTPNGY